MRRLPVTLLLFLGCTPFVRDQAVEADRSSEEQIRKSRRIVIVTSSWGVHSGSQSTRLVLEPGRWQSESTRHERMKPLPLPDGSYPPDPNPQGPKSGFLSPAVYAEVQRLLIESKVWAIKEREQPEFEAGMRFTIEWEGEKHSFNYYPKECSRFNDYVTEIIAKVDSKK